MFHLSRTTSALCALVFVAVGCGDNGGGGVDGSPADSPSNNPPNPLGLGPAPVDLGGSTDLAAAGSYVILAKTGITNVTGSSITGGHLGLSPAAASFITGFDLVEDASTEFSTSASVVSPSRVYASDYSPPTPTNLTTAVLDMQAGYEDAASRTNPDFLNLGSGDLSGLTLEPGLYTWGSGVTIPTDVTISGGATDVWIFQISSTLEVDANKQVLLTGGALAKNVYWQVAGAVTLHADSQFAGIILAKTGITLQTSAIMKGRALSQTLVALDNNAITAP